MNNNKSEKLSKNIAYMTIYHIFTAISPLITTPYLSRVLGATEIGKYTYAYSLAYYFVLAANLGITTHGSRKIAEAKQNQDQLNRQFSSLFWLHTFIGLIVTVIYLIAVLVGMNKANTTLSLIMTFYVLSGVVDVKWLFYGLENFRVTVLRSIVIKIIYIGLIFILVRTRNDVAIYTFIMAFFAFFLTEASLFILFPKYVKLSKPDLYLMKSEFIPLLLLFIPSVANHLLRHFDKIMIGQMSTYEQLGMYENTDRIFLILVTIITAVGDVLLPRISSLRATEASDKADKLFHYSLRLSIIVSCAFAFGLMAISEEFVPFFFGRDFSGCIELLTWIAPSIIMLTFSASIRKQYLIPRYLEKVYLTATISSLIINIIANAMFIPKYDALGAVYGTLIAEISVVLIQFAFIHKQLDYRPYIKDLLLYSMVGLMMYLAVRTVAHLDVNLFLLILIEVFIGATVYVVLVLLLMKLSNDDLLKMLKAKLLKN